MIAFIGNFDFTELLVIAAVALMAFGKRLPEVAMRAAVQIARARRALMEMWREAGLEDELRRVRRDVEREANLAKLESPLKMAKDAGRKYMQDVEKQLDVEATVKADFDSKAPNAPAAPDASDPATPPAPRPPSQPTQARGTAMPSEGPSPTLPPAASSADEVSEPSSGPDLTPRPVRRAPQADAQPQPADPSIADDRREDQGARPNDGGDAQEGGRETA